MTPSIDRDGDGINPNNDGGVDKKDLLICVGGPGNHCPVKVN